MALFTYPTHSIAKIGLPSSLFHASMEFAFRTKSSNNFKSNIGILEFDPTCEGRIQRDT
jgi:hypothetical protein